MSVDSSAFSHFIVDFSSPTEAIEIVKPPREKPLLEEQRENRRLASQGDKGSLASGSPGGPCPSIAGVVAVQAGS